jgi:hypothetical protein
VTDWKRRRESGEWLGEAVRYFRAMGFFAHYADMTDDELAAKIREYHGIDWEEYIAGAADQGSAEMFLLMADVDRVWFRDLEGVYKGDQAYAHTLEEWASISRGAFRPSEVEETWESDRGPVRVTFRLDGARHEYVHADGNDDFINLEILKLVNGLLRDAPYRLEAADNLGDCRFIVALSREERERVRRERGWSFCDLLTGSAGDDCSLPGV